MPRHKDEPPQVFDISRPSRVSPDPTSRPLIVGHHPMMSDPMVDERPLHHHRSGEPPKVTSVPVKTDEGMTLGAPSLPDTDHTPAPSQLPESLSPEPEKPAEPPVEPSPPLTPWEPLSPLNAPAGISPPSAPDHPVPPPIPQPTAPPPEIHPEANLDTNHLAGSLAVEHPPGAGPQGYWRKPLMWLGVIILLLFGYAVADAKTSLPLPFHPFRTQPLPAASITTPPPVSTQNSAQSSEPVLPAGFTKYSLAGTSLSFAYPTNWGAPSLSIEQGFSQRGGTNKAGGTYAYLINFATNKDVQLAVTSNKYLPPTRAAQYYDFLQWCTPANDTKIYKQLLLFTTAKGIDTPNTIACAQGPLADATKLNDTTITQLKTKATDGKTILGDVYTKNLTNQELTVLRIKDATMTSSTDIKTLLATIKETQ